MIRNLLERSRHLTVEERRSVSEDYAEIVILAEQLDAWNTLLTELYGPAAKPAGCKPSPVDQRHSEPYGGIFRDQILYRLGQESIGWIAMLWPWKDKLHITVKLAKIKL